MQCVTWLIVRHRTPRSWIIAHTINHVHQIAKTRLFKDHHGITGILNIIYGGVKQPSLTLHLDDQCDVLFGFSQPFQ